MSLNNEDGQLSDELAEMDNGARMMTKITYSRDFLLSLSELDVCKRLPREFEKSVLSELEDAFQDRQWVSGNISSHGFRRTEYGSSPPARGESGNYLKGIHGRWDSRTSGCSDKDADSLTDWDSDSGRRFGNQSRWVWQVSDHDGLLGSGSFPRPSGYTTGLSGSKFRANKTYQPNKSSEPYNPPRPYKAVPQSRRETKDSYNDETFGSSECTSEDRVEEERKRRASFELMRKEQLKAIHEKKLNPGNQKEDFDITMLLEDSNDEKRLMNKNRRTEKPSVTPKAPTGRPLIPPGFANTALDKNIGSKSSNQPHGVGLEDSLINTAGFCVTGTASNHRKEQTGQQLVLTEKPKENAGTLASTSFKDDRSSSFPETFRASENTEVMELGGQQATDNDILSDRSQDHSAVVLDKIFAGALTLNSSSADESCDGKKDDMWSPHFVQSSKFAQWFEEDQNPISELSSDVSIDLLSLIGGSGKSGSQPADARTTEHIPIKNQVESPELADSHIVSMMTSCVAENSRQLYDNKNPEVVPLVLTCEDLEQKMLLEASESSVISSSHKLGWNTSHEKIEQPKAAFDDRATEHLLSLLQKETGPKVITPFSNMDVMSSKNIQNSGGGTVTALNSLKEEHGEINTELGNALTLEMLFGTAFMKELQSVGAPVSAHRGLIGLPVSVEKASLEPPRGDASDLGMPPVPTTENYLLSSKLDINAIHQSNVLPSNQMHKTKSGGIGEQCLGFSSSRKFEDSFQLQSGSDAATGMLLCEDDGSLTVNDTSKFQLLTAAGNPSKPSMLTSSNAPVDFVDRLAILNSVPRGNRPNSRGLEDAPFFRSPCETKESDIPYNLHRQPSAQQLHSPQFNQGGQLFQSLDSNSSNINSQMKLMPPEGIIHHASPNPLLANVVPSPTYHSGSGLTRFDLPPHHPLLQQMQVPGNYTSPHLLGGFPLGTLPPHPNNQVTNYMPDLNPLKELHMGHRQPDFRGPPVPLSAPDSAGGNNHSEALRRLIEMELRSNPKQIHSYAGKSQAMYGHRVDMGFGYR